MPQDGQPRRVSLVVPIILITVGALFLLHNWRPAFDPGPILWTYWPLILIFVGIGKIWDSSYRSRNPNAAPAVSIGGSARAVPLCSGPLPLFSNGPGLSLPPRLPTGTHHHCRNLGDQVAGVDTPQ